jgi:hypothetical protein
VTIVLGEGGLSWAQARDKVRGDLWRPGTGGVPDDVVDRALHASMQQIESERRWLWLENVDAALNITVDDDHVDLPASVQSVSSIAYRNGSGYDRLNAASLGRVREASIGSRGWPAWYAQTDGTLYFDTTVPAGNSFELIFTGHCPDYLDDAIASPSVTLARQQQAVIAHACHLVALSYLKNEAEAARQLAAYDRHLERMMNIEDQQRGDLSGGCIMPDTAYQDAAYGRVPMRI